LALKKGVPGVAKIGDPQEDAFLRSILENLKEDTPRLVYADWLQEQGNPWGEFIRCQVLAAQKATPAAQKKKHKARAEELLKQHQWLPSFFDPERTKVERGFVTKYWIEMDDDEDDEEGGGGRDAVLAPLAANPFFALTPAYVDFDYEENYMFSIVVRVPRLGCLGTIAWESCNLGCLYETDPEEGESPLAEVLMGSPHLAGLRELRLSAVGLQNNAVEALAKNPAVTSLRVLDIGSDGGMEVSGNYFDDKGVKALANSPHLPELEELDLSDGGVSDKGIKFLCDSPYLPKLKSLNLSGVCLSDKGYLTLARSPFTARLEELHIGKGYYQDRDVPTDVGARALAESPYLEHIKKLNIELWSLSPEVREALRARFGKRLELRE
jgi:uncharacterized protein (TIGR02996 family)